LSSPRRKQGKPIQSVVLKVGFRADRRTLSRIRKAVPGARWQRGQLEVSLATAGPAEMADRTKELSDRVRDALGGGEGTGTKAKSSKRL